MNVAQFLTTFRGFTGDQKAPYLWSDVEVLGYLVDALNEACERARLIEDESTAACCTLTLAAAASTFALHASVFEVKELRFRGRPLDETSTEAEAGEDGTWRTRTGEPRRFIVTDTGAGLKVRLVPAPTSDLDGETIDLTVYRRELTPRELAGANSAAPELNARWHERLMHWMYHRAYSKNDAETLNPQKAGYFEALFTRDFGERIDANAQRKQRDRRPPIVRSSW